MFGSNFFRSEALASWSANLDWAAGGSSEMESQYQRSKDGYFKSLEHGFPLGKSNERKVRLRCGMTIWI